VRGFVALLRRELRDARWHVAASAFVAAAVPFAIHLAFLGGADDETVATIGGRWIAPGLFALFAAATASDLVARDVATKRIETLAVLPVAIGRVWTAKALFLAAACVAFLAWILAAESAAVAACASDGALARLPAALGDAAPSFFAGFALAAAAFFFSTLVDRGMAAGLAALVAIVGVAWAVQWAEIPAAPGLATIVVTYAAPLGLASAFVVASRVAFVRGPIHGPSKLRLVAAGVVPLVALAVPGGAAAAMTLDSATSLAAGDGELANRWAAVSPDGKWVAVEDSLGGPRSRSRTWLLGFDDGSCREVAPGNTWFGGEAAWTHGSTLYVLRSSFSMISGPRYLRGLEVEPSRLGVVENIWVPHETAHDDTGAHAGHATWGSVRVQRTISPGRTLFEIGWYGRSKRIECRDVVLSPRSGVAFVTATDGTLSRLDLTAHTSTPLAANVVQSPVPDGDGRRILLRDGRRVIDATTGEVVLSGWDGGAWWTGTSCGLLQTWTCDATHCVARSALRDLDARTTVDLGAPLFKDRIPYVARLRDGRLVVCDGEVTLRDAKGAVIRRLFPPPSAAERGN
jgi:hypothetical protein